jgi:hypothetical protein
MFRTPIPTTEISQLENCSPEQLLAIFESCVQNGFRRMETGLISGAWGMLFSHYYLSAEELVEEVESGEHRLGEAREQMLRVFIKADCARGSPFVMDVIRKGGKIDRAALIMIAELEDLATIELNGTTALHLLADACDKGVRPALIRRAGKRLLSQVFDRRGIPVIFSIYALGDLSTYDLKAIAKVYSRDELRQVMSRNRSGKNALTVFDELSAGLKIRASMDRNTFFKTNALKSTNTEGELRSQVDPVAGSLSPNAASGRRSMDPGSGSLSDTGGFDALRADAPDAISTMMKKRPDSG